MDEIKTKAATKEYRENYDRIFNRKSQDIPLVFDNDNGVVLLIKTLDGDIYLGDTSRWN